MFAKTIAALVLAAPLFGAEATIVNAPNPLTVHEWGTFTSVANEDGAAVDWRALGGKPDLPCFVYRSQIITKGEMYTRVRMETPVLYFYAHQPLSVSAKVAFPNGRLTEWYPKAQADLWTLKWNVEVLPNADLGFPTGRGESHYYAARETDAAPLRAGEEQEKLLFYRGAGDFQPPARPRFTSPTTIEIKGSIGAAILFENRDGRIGWRRVAGKTVERPEPGGNLADLRADLVRMLTDAGLYLKEAQAMVATWRDSWFEEGMRLLYVVPRDFVDAALPLEIAPKPRGVERVFMGRAEMLSPERREELSRALETSDFSHVQRYDRFFSAFARQVAKFTTPSRSMQYVSAREQASYSGPCVE